MDGEIHSTGAGAGGFAPVQLPLHDRPLPGPEEVHLWYLDLGRLGGSLRRALGEDGAGAAQRPSARQLRFARRFHLRLLLGAYLGLPGKDVTILRSGRGKPVLDYSAHDSSLHFSMAKSEQRLLVGVSVVDPVGVDLEPLDRKARDPLQLARRYFTAAEAEALARVPPQRLQRAFLRAWACKEAVVKASGEGIANQFCRFTVQADPDQPAALLGIEEDDAARWSLALLRPEPDFLGAVALRRGAMRISCFCLQPAAPRSGV